MSDFIPATRAGTPHTFIRDGARGEWGCSS